MSTQYGKFIGAAAIAFACCATAQARPVVVEESQSLDAPGRGYSYFAQSVAIDRDWALATALRSGDGSFNYPYRQLALLYRRSGNTWSFDRILVNDSTEAVTWNDPKVAMKDGLASVSTAPLRAFRLADGDWHALPNPFPAVHNQGSWANGLTRIDGTTVASIAGRCRFSAITADLLPATADDTWSAPRLVAGNNRLCSISNYSGSMDIEGNRLVFSNPQEDFDSPPTQLRIYRRDAASQPWRLDGTLPTGEYGFAVALTGPGGEDLLVGSWSPSGNDVYRRGTGGWTHAGHLPTLQGFSDFHDGATHFGKGGEFVLVSTARFDDLPSGIAVYRRDADGDYEHVAQLASSRGDELGPVAEISGRTVIVSGWSRETADQGRLYFFELPADLSAPALQDDNFEDGDAAGWTVESGTATVIRRGPSRVLRQSAIPDLSSTPRSGALTIGAAVLAASRTNNQAVQADIQPVTFSRANAWTGLGTRYIDTRNHYSVALIYPDQIALRRVRAGRTQTLASAPVVVRAARRYHLRLESIGSRHRVYLNGRRVLEALDSQLDHGRVAMLSSDASADFDNLTVTPSHRTPLYEAEIPNGSACEQFVREQELRASGVPEWDCSDYEAGYLRQTSVEGIARAAIGPVTDDQIVESRVQLEFFSESGNQDKWLGVMTRYTDENNYYYFALRSSKVMALRKLVNGRIVELGRADFMLPSDAWLTLKLQAVGDRLRAFVNGQLVIQAEDSDHPIGISGIVTWRAAARFDYLRVSQP